MSYTVQVCLKYKGTLEALKADVENVVGMELSHYETGGPLRKAYYGKLVTIDVELSTNYLETDRELNFSDFQYVLSTRVAAHACSKQLLKLQEPLTDTIGMLLCKYLGVEVMIIVEAQQLLARYMPDAVCGDEEPVRSHLSSSAEVDGS